MLEKGRFDFRLPLTISYKLGLDFPKITSETNGFFVMNILARSLENK